MITCYASTTAATSPISVNFTLSEALQLRSAQPWTMGRRVGDEFTVPLCRAHHRELHDCGNEAAWWHDMGIDPIEIAGQLWDGDRETERWSSSRYRQR